MAATYLTVTISEGVNLTALLKDSNISTSTAHPNAFVCAIRYSGKEIARTDACTDPNNMTWRDRHIDVVIDAAFEKKQSEHNRPYIYDYLEVFIFDASRSQSDRVGETRIPLLDIGATTFYKVLRPGSISNFVEFEATSRLEITLECVGDMNKLFPTGLSRLMLSQVVPPEFPQHHHLFLDPGAHWSPNRILGASCLPGPLYGEFVLEKHDDVEVGIFELHLWWCRCAAIITRSNFVFMSILSRLSQWKLALGVNAFGDKHAASSKGTLIVTDLRIIFLPREIRVYDWTDVVVVDNFSERPWTCEELLTIRRMTFQVAFFAM